MLNLGSILKSLHQDAQLCVLSYDKFARHGLFWTMCYNDAWGWRREAQGRGEESRSMTSEARKLAQQISIGAAQVHLKNLRLRDDITIDEVRLNSGDLSFTHSDIPGDAITIAAGETQ